MVTAVVIPILIFYFYWITKREGAKQKQRWEKLGQVKLEARIQGKIVFLEVEKKRYYQQYFMMVTFMQIRNKEGVHSVVLYEPYDNQWKPHALKKGDDLLFLGKWEKDTFVVGELTLSEK